MNQNRYDKLWIQIIAEKAITEIGGFPDPGEVEVYPDSVQRYELSSFASVRIRCNDFLLIIMEEHSDYGFTGETAEVDDMTVMLCPENEKNLFLLGKLFPFTNPSVIGKSKSTFGVGDRLGIAGPGHIRVFNKSDIVPVLAQQSLRELDLTGRKYSDVIAAASWAVYKSGFKKPWAADGDHLKHAKDVSSAILQGCTMITADLSDHIDFSISGMSLEKIRSLYENLDSAYRKRIEKTYIGKTVIGNVLNLEYNTEDLASVVLTYKKAIEHAGFLYNTALKHRENFDFEISIDETELPTTLEAHYFVAKELIFKEIKYTSIAPRYVGEFQKGIDYIGSIEDFDADFRGHAMIASELGYKISIHSSSDKFSVYPIIAKNLKGAFHLKTSGTNWLTALEVVAVHDPGLFRELFAFAYEVFPVTSSYYHITPDFKIKTDLASVGDDEILDVFNNPTDRQILHISYGEVFGDSEMKRRLFDLLNAHISDYWKRLEKHIGRHIKLLDI